MTHPNAQWITPRRVKGLRRAVAVAVGEKHSVALQGFWIPKLPECLDLHVLARQVSTRAQQRASQDSDDADGEGDDVDSPSGLGGLSGLGHNRPSDDGSEHNLSTLARSARRHHDGSG